MSNAPTSRPGKAADEHIDLSGQTSVDEQLAGMSVRLQRTRSLVLEGTDVTAAGLKCLKVATHLKSLDLRNTSTTDQDLEQLRGMIQLTFLALDGTRVTREGIAEAHRFLPSTAITPAI